MKNKVEITEVERKKVIECIILEYSFCKGK